MGRRMGGAWELRPQSSGAEESKPWDSSDAGSTANTAGEIERHSQTTAARKERASLAWSCSNPDRDDRATSMASNCSTASPVQASLAPQSTAYAARATARTAIRNGRAKRIFTKLGARPLQVKPCRLATLRVRWSGAGLSVSAEIAKVDWR